MQANKLYSKEIFPIFTAISIFKKKNNKVGAFLFFMQKKSTENRVGQLRIEIEVWSNNSDSQGNYWLTSGPTRPRLYS